MHAERRLNHVAEFSLFHRERCLGELRHHDELIGESTDIAPLVFAGQSEYFLATSSNFTLP